MNMTVKIAMEITADYKYIYDPPHENKPSGAWKQTGSGWSQNNGEEEPAPLVQKSQKKDDDTSVSAPAVEETKNEQIPESPAVEETEQQPTEPKTDEEPETDLFNNGDNGDNEFVTDEEGKEEEQNETGDDTTELDLGADDNGIFDDANRDAYLDPDKHDEYIEKMNSFIERFDEGEGKENDVTFKAVASNLDWSSVEDVKAFSEHCASKGLDGADEILAFLYFTHQDDEAKFDQIIEDMK